MEAFLGRGYGSGAAAPAGPPTMESGLAGGDVHRHRRFDRDDRTPRRPQAAEIVRAHDAVVRRALPALWRPRGQAHRRRHHGFVVDHRGGGRVRGGDPGRFRRLQSGEFRADPGEDRLHAGEPVEDSDDLFGSTVQMAARLCAAGTAGQILVSDNICREHDDQSLFINRKTGAAERIRRPGSSARMRLVVGSDDGLTAPARAQSR